MFILSQTNYNHANLQTSNFMFSCTVITFVLLNLFSASEKNAKFAKLTGSNLFILQQVTATSQFVSDQKCFPPDDIKSGLGCKGQNIFEIQILQILP